MLTRHPTYAGAEAALYADAGIPDERIEDHRLHLATLDCDVRIREISQDGAGEPVLFLHGGPNSGGTWAYLIAQLDGFRCLALDRPGTGLSEPLPNPLSIRDLDTYAEHLATDVLDALGIERAHVVGSSFGGMVGLRSAAAHPERVARMVQMACPAFAPGMLAPPFVRLLGTPLRHVLARLPQDVRAHRMILRQIGHGHSLDTGALPQAFGDWYFALMDLTDTAASEQTIMAESVTWRGFDPTLDLSRDQLAAVTAPTHYIWGEDDGFGGREVGDRMIALMPNATIEYWPRSGHLPWLDDPVRAAKVVTNHLRG